MRNLEYGRCSCSGKVASTPTTKDEEAMFGCGRKGCCCKALECVKCGVRFTLIDESGLQYVFSRVVGTNSYLVFERVSAMKNELTEEIINEWLHEVTAVAMPFRPGTLEFIEWEKRDKAYVKIKEAEAELK